jgi:hypothetical protein
MTLKIGWLHEAEHCLGTWLHEADDWHYRRYLMPSGFLMRPQLSGGTLAGPCELFPLALR